MASNGVITNGDLYKAREALEVLVSQKFPVLVSYKLAKMVNDLNGQFQALQKAHQILLEKLGTKKGKRYEITEDSPNFEAFMEEFNSLMDIPSDIKVAKVKLPESIASTCDACHHNMNKPLELEPRVLMALEKFVEV